MNDFLCNKTQKLSLIFFNRVTPLSGVKMAKLPIAFAYTTSIFLLKTHYIRIFIALLI